MLKLIVHYQADLLALESIVHVHNVFVVDQFVLIIASYLLAMDYQNRALRVSQVNFVVAVLFDQFSEEGHSPTGHDSFH